MCKGCEFLCRVSLIEYFANCTHHFCELNKKMYTMDSTRHLTATAVLVQRDDACAEITPSWFLLTHEGANFDCQFGFYFSSPNCLNNFTCRYDDIAVSVELTWLVK